MEPRSSSFPAAQPQTVIVPASQHTMGSPLKRQVSLRCLHFEPASCVHLVHHGSQPRLLLEALRLMHSPVLRLMGTSAVRNTEAARAPRQRLDIGRRLLANGALLNRALLGRQVENLLLQLGGV